VTALLLLLAALVSDSRLDGLQAAPVSWGDDCLSLRSAPASLSRLEATRIGLYALSGNDGSSFEGAAGLTLGAVRLGIDCGSGSTGADTSFAAAGAAFVLTGDPRGFLEGFFGPSISIGGVLETSWTGNGEPTTGASASVQFSVFPTFALGAALRDVCIEEADGRELDMRGEYGATYIFNRDFRACMSYSEGRASVGCELAVSRPFAVRAGTDGEKWSAGTRVSWGDLTLDLAALFDDSTVSSSASILFDIGGESPWR